MTYQRVNIDVNKNLWKQVGIEAIKNDVTRREIVEVALKEYLNRRSKQ